MSSPTCGVSPPYARWRQLATAASSPESSSASHSVPTSQPRLAPSASSSSGAACSTPVACASTRVTSWRAPSSCWPRACSVMSWNWTKNSVGQPSSSVSAVALTSIQRASPWPVTTRPCVWWVRISPVSMRSNSRLRTLHSSGWMVLASVRWSSSASVRPSSLQSAALTRRKRPSVPIIAIPVGASSNACTKRCGASGTPIAPVPYASPARSVRGNSTTFSGCSPPSCSAAGLRSSERPSRSFAEIATGAVSNRPRRRCNASSSARSSSSTRADCASSSSTAVSRRFQSRGLTSATASTPIAPPGSVSGTPA